MNKKNKNLVYGVNPIIESLKSGKQFDKIMFNRVAGDEKIKAIRDLAKKLDQEIHFQNVPTEKLNRLTQANHQGIIGFTSAVEYQDLENLVSILFDRGTLPLLLMLDGITDVRNFGAICRNAASFSVDAVIVPTQGGAAINADAIKTSAGTLNNLSICREKDLRYTVKKLQSYGLKIYALTEKTDALISDCNFADPCCIIMGSEDKGVQNSLLTVADELIRIPIADGVDSLNVSVAAGIALFCAAQQRAK